MKAVKVGKMIIGEGLPKICIPIVATTKNAVLEEAENAVKLPMDFLEWRVDWYEDCFDIAKVAALLKEMKQHLGQVPILFTFRTAKEGGEKEITAKEYKALLSAVIQTQQIDLIDIEFFQEKEVVQSLLKEAKHYHIKTILSNHDFQKTPSEEEMIERLCAMQSYGCDITKIAVMPKSKKDVICVLSVTEKMQSFYGDRPFITMSMGAKGAISRMTGEVFGSAVTFGAAQKSSAPGQIEAKRLKQALEIIHSSLS